MFQVRSIFYFSVLTWPTKQEHRHTQNKHKHRRTHRINILNLSSSHARLSLLYCVYHACVLLYCCIVRHGFLCGCHMFCALLVQRGRPGDFLQGIPLVFLVCPNCFVSIIRNLHVYCIIFRIVSYDTTVYCVCTFFLCSLAVQRGRPGYFLQGG